MELTKQAVPFQSSRKMSYTDCFAAASAKLRRAELVMGKKDKKFNPIFIFALSKTRAT